MNTHRTTRCGRAASLPIALLLFSAGAAGQVSPVSASPTTATKPPAAEEVLELTAFVVTGDSDVGYQGSNTTSGSRLKTSLKDSPASISVLTTEFLADFALNDIGSALGYAANIEPELNDAKAGFADPSARTGNSNGNFRVRGITGGFAANLMETGAYQDNYNVERFEVSSGPNSVLFGLGAAGGTVSLTTKRARLDADKYTVRFQTGSGDQLRAETDLRQVLVPKKLGLRLLALHEDSNSWRHWDYRKQDRFTGAVVFRPFRDTTVHASYEHGTYDKHITWRWNVADGYLAWAKAGSPIGDFPLAGTGAALATNQLALVQTSGVVRIGTTDRWTVVDNEGGKLYNYRNEFSSASAYAGYAANGTNFANSPVGQTALPFNLSPIEFSISGPGGNYGQKFSNYHIIVEQRLGKNLAAEYGHYLTDTKVRANVFTVPNNSSAIIGDPNLTLANTGLAANPVVNPNAGRLYMESQWQLDQRRHRNEVDRLTIGYDLNAGPRFGSHRFAVLGEQSRLNQQTASTANIVLKNGAPASGANPEGSRYWQRNYLTVGNFSTYYHGDPSVGMTPVTVGADVFSTRRASVNANDSNDTKRTDSLLLVMQNKLWRDRIHTTFGYRIDDLNYKVAKTERTAAGDPLVQSGEKLPNEWRIKEGAFDEYRYKPKTQTAGVVFHATSRFSVFYNQASNIGAPALGGTVMPSPEQLAAGQHAVVAPPLEGKGRDYGVMVDLTGDNRYFFRLTRYVTEEVGNPDISPGAAANEAVFYTNAILDLLSTGTNPTWSLAQADQFRLSYNRLTVSSETKGYEAEVILNPAKNWTVRLTYSYSDRSRSGYAKEVDWYFSDAAQKLYNNQAPLAYFASVAKGKPVEADVNTAIANMIAARADSRLQQEQTYSSRPAKASLATRYSVSEGTLKGLFVGTGVRFTGKNLMAQVRQSQIDQVKAAQNTGPLFEVAEAQKHLPADKEMLWGRSSLFVDPFIGYRRALGQGRGKRTCTVQWNVNNAFNSDRITPGRSNDIFNGLKRYYLADPRSHRMTFTVDF